LKHQRARGFTLLEIIAVVALIALAATVVVVSVGSGLEGARVRSASKDLVAALRYTRGQAIVQRSPQALLLEVDARAYQAPGRERRELPRNMELRLVTARDELVGEGAGRIRFFPDGSSTGGQITLALGEAEWSIDVEWLTGEVKLRDPAEER